MRQGDRYECTKCRRRRVQRDALCRPGCPRARDEHGNAPALPETETEDRALRGRPVHPFMSLWFLGPVFDELRIARRQSRRRKQLKKQLAEAGPLTAIGDARDGLVRVEGRVTVLEPATPAAGRGHIGAFEWRTVADIAAAGVAVRRITTRRGWGRFTIDDGTGVALIDDEFLALRDFKGRETEPHEAGGIAVRDGCAITVLGNARRAAVDLPTHTDASKGYRQRALPLVFDGSSDAPLVIFAEPNVRDPA